MATKTWKIGEYAKGGIITVETKKNTVTVISKEWDMSTGTRRSSDQSNAKEAERREFNNKGYRQMMDYLCDLTTSYYADQIAKWIETKFTFDKGMFGW